MITRTTAAATALNARHPAPILLVRASLPGGTQYWASKGGTYGGQAYEGRLLSGVVLRVGMDGLGRVKRTLGEIRLANGADPVTGARPSDLFATDVIAGQPVQIDLYEAATTAPTDYVRVFTGALDVPEADAFDDVQLRLLLLDDGNPTYAGLQALNCGRIHKLLASRINATDWPSADPDAIGQVIPWGFGTHTDHPAYPVDAGALDALAADIDDTDTTIAVSSATAFALFPASGTLQIEDEQITYTGKGTLTFTGCTRGAGGTTAAAHVAGRPVWEIQASYVYLVSEHAYQAVSAVRVAGVLIDPASYTVSLAGPTTITFTGKPVVKKTVAVTTQPTFTAAVTSEQSPGSIAVTGEQSPGAISTTAEHGHSTNTGSHDHDTEISRHEYHSSPSSIPGTITATADVTFANTPKSGTTANFHIRVTNKSGTWVFRVNGGATLISDLGGALASNVEDYYCTQSSPGTSYQIANTAGATPSLTVAIVERDIVQTQASSADAAAGVSASATGATASSMASLSGATAANMASLAGSTAVGLTRTVDAVVSAADLVVGGAVTCDVQAIPDDGSGTYTGTPNAAILNPADQLKWLLHEKLGLTVASWIHATSWAAARAAWAAAGIEGHWIVTDAIDSSELLERLRWSLCARCYQRADGTFALHVLPLAGSAVKTFTEAADIAGDAAGGHAIRVGLTPITDLYNEVFVCYGKRLSGGGYAGYVSASDATSQSTNRMTRTLILENDFLTDATDAQWVADTYLAQHKDRGYLATLAGRGLPEAHLELCDPVAITGSRMPGGWTAKAFTLEQVGLDLVPAGRVSVSQLVGREV